MDEKRISIDEKLGNNQIIMPMKQEAPETKRTYGNVLSRNTPFGNLSYSYDNGNKMENVTSGDVSVDYSYDGKNYLTSKSYSNGMRANFTSDAMGRMERVTYNNSSNSVLADYTYSRDGVGNITQVDELNQSISYSYNANNMLIGESSSAINNSFGYDVVGNRKDVNGTTVSFNNRDQITSNYYDNMGRLLNDGNINYTWSDNDRLISIKKVGVTTNYLYNADGLRTGKLSDSDTSYYLVDPTLPYGQVLAEYGSDTTFYVYGLQREIAISDNDTNYFVFDGQNSVRHLVDGNEQITDSYSYDAYGNITESDGVTENSFLYRGEQFDLESGNYYLRSRYYSPISASFISFDPFVGDVSNPISLNKYLYGNGNPVMFSDPSGNVGIGGAMATIAIAGILATLPTPVYATAKKPIEIKVNKFEKQYFSYIIDGISIESRGLGINIEAITKNRWPTNFKEFRWVQYYNYNNLGWLIDPEYGKKILNSSATGYSTTDNKDFYYDDSVTPKTTTGIYFKDYPRRAYSRKNTVPSYWEAKLYLVGLKNKGDTKYQKLYEIKYGFTFNKFGFSLIPANSNQPTIKRLF